MHLWESPGLLGALTREGRLHFAPDLTPRTYDGQSFALLGRTCSCSDVLGFGHPASGRGFADSGGSQMDPHAERSSPVTQN